MFVLTKESEQERIWV